MTTMPLVWLPLCRLDVAWLAFPTGFEARMLFECWRNNLGDVAVMRILRSGRCITLVHGVGRLCLRYVRRLVTLDLGLRLVDTIW